jgi:hypothetical protein
MELALYEVEDMNATELTTAFARLEERVTNHIRFFWVIVGALVLSLGWVSLQLYQIKGSIKPLAANQTTTQLIIAAADPTDPTSPVKVAQAIAEAKKTQTPIPATVLNKTGQAFVDASAEDPKAWDTTKVLMEYRANLNSLTFVFPPTSLPVQSTRFTAKAFDGKPGPHLSVVSQGVPAAQVARLQPIGQNTNPTISSGPSHLLAAGGAILLNGMDIAHVIFVGVEVHYDGGPLQMQDVLFINCTFVFTNTDQTRDLAKQIISSKEVYFTS